MKAKLRANAKINLSLEIIGKRPDGYHNLSMIMQSIDIYDKIEIELTADKAINLTTNKSFGDIKDNIAYKAAAAFFAYTGVNMGCNINLTKNIPSEAGLAGGSTDAAGVILGLDKLTGANLSKDNLIALATSLGADVSFCLFGGTMKAEGTGNLLEKLPFIEMDLLIVKPDKGVSTKDLFKSLDRADYSSGEYTKKLSELIKNGVNKGIEEYMVNKMYSKSLKFAPEMETIIFEMENKFNCDRALMSGAGSTIFAIFSDKEERQNAYDYFSKKYKHVYKTKTCDKSVIFY